MNNKRWMWRYFAKLGLLLGGLNTLVCGGLWLYVRSPRSPVKPQDLLAPTQAKGTLAPEMWRTRETKSRIQAPNPLGFDSGGNRVPLMAAANGRPIVIAFIGKDCPDSLQGAPFFGRLHKLYEGKASFIDVIDGTNAEANQWRERSGVDYPVLASPDGSVMAAYGVRRPLYTALIRRDGSIDSLWPGCSDAMLRALNRRIASLVGEEPRRLNTAGAPTGPTSGCEFRFDR